MGQIDGRQVALGNRALFAELGIELGDLVPAGGGAAP